MLWNTYEQRQGLKVGTETGMGADVTILVCLDAFYLEVGMERLYQSYIFLYLEKEEGISDEMYVVTFH